MPVVQLYPPDELRNRVPSCRGACSGRSVLKQVIQSGTAFLMRATFSTLSLFGALGIFLFYLSWFTPAEFSAHGSILLGSATCIVFSLQHGAWIRKR